MPKNLLIVESPAKAKTIEKFLGKDFTVKSSFGHIRDLDKGNKGVDVSSKFKPRYVVTPDKKKVVKELKDWVKKVDDVWLATDEDREGEAISWHLCKVLGLDEESTKRIVFREITKPAIQRAIENPRTVNLALVDAQQARRILDRLVGFELSEILWRKVRNKLSAGRVQSVAVKLVVEKEREIQAHQSKDYFKVQAIFMVSDEYGKKSELKADLSERFDTEEEARKFLENSIDAQYRINKIEKKPLKRRPSAPFTTSTLQQEASRKLGFAVKRTMSAAQKLYEQGHITYMRTDSTSLSDQAIRTLGSVIRSEYGEEYHESRQYATKKELAQEAHEAIRPTYAENEMVAGDRDMQRLYELIWKRTVASQMADARLEKTVAHISISTQPDLEYTATGEVLKFEGFLKVYMESSDDDEEEETKGMLPPLKEGQELKAIRIEATQKFSRPPARYTEASLVKKLEELGIGRPSTYAPTISKIMEEDRGYVTKESRPGEERKYAQYTMSKGNIEKKTLTEITGATTNRLYPSDIGMIVTDFLDEHFEEIMEYGFTAQIENYFDEIAEGKKKWKEVLEDFYTPFHKDVEETIDNASRATGERMLGTDEETGHSIVARMTRYGPVIQIGKREEVGEDEKPRFANLKPGQSIETITLEDALDLFKLPVKLGEYEGKEVLVNTGRYGPYVKFGDTFISIGRRRDPLEVNYEEAVELIKAKLKEDAPVAHYKGKPVTRGKGRFGPFLKWNDMYINIPRKFDPEGLTQDQMFELIEKKVEKEANRYIKQWESEKIAIENGRWGPFIRFKKKSVKLPKNKEGKKMTGEEAAEMTLDEVKAAIEAEIPNAFPKKKSSKSKSN
jgi:DNA topoisomerase-1